MCNNTKWNSNGFKHPIWGVFFFYELGRNVHHTLTLSLGYEGKKVNGKIVKRKEHE
jgi:hypothetical protein